MIKFLTSSDSDTFALGAALGKYIKENNLPRAFIAVYGDLGAGKTVFTKGMASVLAPKSRVKSPSYTIVNQYLSGNVPVYHFDFYRINSTLELEGIGYDDCVDGGICIAEWCEKIEGELPIDTVSVNIEKCGDTSREISFKFPDTEAFKNVDLRI